MLLYLREDSLSCEKTSEGKPDSKNQNNKMEKCVDYVALWCQVFLVQFYFYGVEQR